jgi:hypothetical protein
MENPSIGSDDVTKRDTGEAHVPQAADEEYIQS